MTSLVCQWYMAATVYFAGVVYQVASGGLDLPPTVTAPSCLLTLRCWDVVLQSCSCDILTVTSTSHYTRQYKSLYQEVQVTIPGSTSHYTREAPGNSSHIGGQIVSDLYMESCSPITMATVTMDDLAKPLRIRRIIILPPNTDI